MSHQPPQQSGWGQQPTQPGWGPQPPTPKKSSAGKIVGFSCLGIIGLFVIIGIIGAVLGGASDDSESGGKTAATQDAQPDKADDEKAGKEKDEPKEEPAKDAPVTVKAKKVDFKKTILADGSDYTSVQVTVTNGGDKELDVNPLYFSITDTEGSKHAAELGVDEGQIDTVKLAPGENITGTITGKGAFSPKYVTYTDGLFGDGIRGDVS
ncbi:DUF4352 domain-containing protein [Streptomyces sp. NPDC095613]|uniref:DUF4352 domain-containing protein n=1 Tax=Streptomyces sp. NPDC095613 TaxID=3155540 RepID=UPI0033252E16